MGIMTSTLREELTYPLKIDGWKVFIFLGGGYYWEEKVFRVKYSSEKTRHTRPNIILLLFDPLFLVGVAGGFGGKRLAW